MLFWTSSFTQEERYVSAGEYTANQSFAAVEKWSAWGSRLWSLNSLDALSFSAGALWVACRSKIPDAAFVERRSWTFGRSLTGHLPQLSAQYLNLIVEILYFFGHITLVRHWSSKGFFIELVRKRGITTRNWYRK